MTFNNVYGGMHKTRAASKIAANQVNALTEPENVARGILKELGYGYRLQEMIVCVALDSAEFIITCDLYIVEHKIAVEVDGVYHKTKRQEKKTEWRDNLLIANGYKVVHIDGEYTKNESMKMDLRDKLEAALFRLKSGQSKVERID